MVTFKASTSSSPPAPTVTAISPTSGTASGGTVVVLLRDELRFGCDGQFRRDRSHQRSVVSSTSITATTPAHTAGAVSVVVTNSNGESGTLSNGYTLHRHRERDNQLRAGE